MTITVTESRLQVKGKGVSQFTLTLPSMTENERNELVKSLCENLTRPAATALVLSFFGTATTAEVAEHLGMDRSNAFRYLSTLAEKGEVRVVDNGRKTGSRGRPTHVWELA